MKIIRIANNIKKSASYKVRYTDQMGQEQEKTLNLESPEKATQYIKFLTRGKGKVLDVEEVARQETKPKPAPQKPSRKRAPRNVRVIRNPNPSAPPQKGYRINYYEDFAGSGGLKSKIYDVGSREEAVAVFEAEFPNGVIEGNPLKLDVGPITYDYDETGKRQDQRKSDWLFERHLENLPADEQRKRLLERERKRNQQ